MKVRILVGVIALLLVASVVISLIAWFSRPRLIEIHPRGGTANVPATTVIRLVFSRAMDPRTVESHLIIEPETPGTFSWKQNMLTFIPDKPWPGNQKITLTLDAGARAVSAITFAMGKQSWSFETSGETLAYLWPSDGQADIYALNPVTGAIQQFTHGMGVLDYSVSSDGMVLYFSARNDKGGASLYQINRAGDQSSSDNSYLAEELLDCDTAQCRNPVASFDNRYLAYEYILPMPNGGSVSSQIWLLDLASKIPKPIGLESHLTVEPAWSSNGLLAYYDQTGGGYEVVNPITLDRTLFPNQTGQPIAWSKGGDYFVASEISYTPAGGGTETGISHLIRYSIQSETSEDISRENQVEDVEACYSPDGTTIAFARKFLDPAQWSLGRQIWLMHADGSSSHPITDEADYNHYDLAWSLDGRMIAYVRFNQAKLSDQPELWILNADGSDPTQLVIRGYSPLWLP